MSKRILLLLLLLLPCILTPVCFGQQATHVVTGKVVDESDGAPIPAADVLVTDLEDHILSYGATDSLGRFNVDNIPSSEVILVVRTMGYDSFIGEKLSLSGDSPEKIDAGVIRLSRSAEGLREVTVTGEKNRIVYKLDRQQISASSSVTASGGTAVDILSGLPSVLVDSDGNLSFRGSTRFLVYVDGKPSPLEGTSALQQIPAASVEDIEILTTPSARYRTDGDAGVREIDCFHLAHCGAAAAANALIGENDLNTEPGGNTDSVFISSHCPQTDTAA